MGSKPWLVVLVLFLHAVLISSKIALDWRAAEEINYAEKNTRSQDGVQHPGKTFSQFPGKVDIGGDHVNLESLAQGLWRRGRSPRLWPLCAPEHCRCRCWCDSHGRHGGRCRATEYQEDDVEMLSTKLIADLSMNTNLDLEYALQVLKLLTSQ